ncbi:MAG: zf-HC2 domain-containing protein [Oscillospiraceae bacterium]|nr:zf-HC2 domain-containing protein [Oscillospiraceae bacterium]
MKRCADYYELISAYIDNELDEKDRLMVERHVETCPHCHGILRAYSEVSSAVTDTMEAPPESIRRRIMAEIVKPAVEKPKAKKILFLSPRAATAALIPFVAGFILFLTLMLRPDGTLPTTMSDERSPLRMTDDIATGAMPPGDSVPEEEVAWEADTAQSIPAPLHRPAEPAATPPQSGAGDAATEPRGAVPDVGFGTNLYAAQTELIDEDDETRFYAIVFVDGEIPPVLAGIEPYVTDCGNLFIIIPRDMVAALIGWPDISVQFRNEAAEYAKVIF